MHRKWSALALLFVAVLSGQRAYGPGRTWWDAGTDELFPNEERYENPDGLVSVMSTNGGFRTQSHPFFQALGDNGRACVTCHQPSNGMSVAAAAVRERWLETAGKDPIFAAVDGANCPDLPQADRASHSLLLDRGLFRIALPWPPKSAPEFRIEVVRDPTGCNATGRPTVSVFRRPRMVANLKYVTGENSLMADGREPSLESQAATAAMVHELAGRAPRADQLKQIVEFESQVYVAQSADMRAGLLREVSGPENVAAGLPLTLDVWRKPTNEVNMGLQREFRLSAVRGSSVFARDCASCHSGPARAMEIGTTNHPVAEALPDLPLFKITCDSGRVVYSQDPGRALITGKCADVGAIVVQQLRGLAARAPYFANGSAATLRDVVAFYEKRANTRYSERDKQDLLNFLTVL
jgi:cytochrome c peroxidase